MSARARCAVTMVASVLASSAVVAGCYESHSPTDRACTWIIGDTVRHPPLGDVLSAAGTDTHVLVAVSVDSSTALMVRLDHHGSNLQRAPLLESTGYRGSVDILLASRRDRAAALVLQRPGAPGGGTSRADYVPLGSNGDPLDERREAVCDRRCDAFAPSRGGWVATQNDGAYAGQPELLVLDGGGHAIARTVLSEHSAGSTSVVSAEDQTLFAVWAERHDGGDRVHGRMSSADGGMLGRPLELGRSPSWILAPRLAAVSGAFVVTWLDQDADHPTLVVARADSDGRVVASNTLPTFAGERARRAYSIATAPDGSGMLAHRDTRGAVRLFRVAADEMVEIGSLRGEPGDFGVALASTPTGMLLLHDDGEGTSATPVHCLR